MISENINGHLALASLLRQFNRKERYWLLNDALGSPPLNISYRKRLENLLGVRVPEDAWWAMDYHFDWLHAALICFERDCTVESLSTPENNAAHCIKGNQEDIDLIICFEQTLLLIEAKGDGAWSSEQMVSKAKRIKSLPRPEKLGIRLILTSHHKAMRIIRGAWLDDIPKPMLAEDGKPFFLELSSFGNGVPLHRVTRCNENGRPDAEGTYWRTQM